MDLTTLRKGSVGLHPSSVILSQKKYEMDVRLVVKTSHEMPGLGVTLDWDGIDSCTEVVLVGDVGGGSGGGVEEREGELSRARDDLRELGEVHLGIPADGNADEE